MTDDPKRKGFIAILLVSVLVLFGLAIIFYFLSYSQLNEKITPSRKQPKPIPSEQLPDKQLTQARDSQTFFESDIDITKIPNNHRLYLALNLSDKSTKDRINIFTKIPENSQVTYSLRRGNELDIKMKINEAEYNIKVPSGGTEGPCPMEEFGSQCGYVDEEIQTLSPVKINTLRIWKKGNGIFLLNPFVITKDNFYVDHIEIIKVQPDAVFKEQEVNMWRDFLESINFEETN